MKELSEQAVISYNYVRSMESGAKGLPATEVLIRLADALDVSVDTLLGRETHDQEIDLSDPVLTFFTSHGNDLTDEEKRVIIDVAKTILARRGHLEDRSKR